MSNRNSLSIATRFGSTQYYHDTYAPTYLPTYLPTYQPTYLPTYLPTYPLQVPALYFWWQTPKSFIARKGGGVNPHDAVVFNDLKTDESYQGLCSAPLAPDAHSLTNVHSAGHLWLVNGEKY